MSKQVTVEFLEDIDLAYTERINFEDVAKRLVFKKGQRAALSPESAKHWLRRNKAKEVAPAEKAADDSGSPSTK